MSVTTTSSADRLLRALLHQTPAGMLIADAVRDSDGRIVDFRYAVVNTKVVSIMGLAESTQLEGRLMSDAFPRSMEEGSYFEKFSQVLNTGEQIEFETDYVNPLGQHGWFCITINCYDDSVTVVAIDITATKKAEHKLQAQTKLLEGVLNSSPAAIFSHEPIRNEAGDVVDFRITLANQTAADLSPRHIVPVADPKWLIGKTLLELSPDSQAFPVMIEVARTGQTQRVVFDYPDYNRAYDFSIVSYGSGLVTTTMDVTAIYQQKQLLQTILDISPTGIVLYEAIRDPQTNTITDFRYRLTNVTNLDVTGRTMEQLMSQTLLTLFPGTGPTDFWRTLIDVTETGQSQRLTFPYADDGVDGWFEGHFAQQADGVLFTFIDITRIKQAEIERQQQANTLERILDSIPAAVFVSEAVYDESDTPQVIDFRVREVNVLGRTPYGLSREQIVGKRASDLFPHDQTNGIFDRYAEVVRTQQPQAFEFSYTQGDTKKWLDVRLVPFDTSSVVASTLDITLIKQAQVTLEAVNDELRRSNDNLQKFAYVASHDLQEPLRKIQSFGDMLATQYGPSVGADGLNMIQRMQVSAARMSALIKDLLTFSRIATQRETHQSLPLNDLITGVLDDLDVVIRESGAQVYVGPLPTVAGDGAQLRHLFQNLISNALKFRQADVPPVVSVTHQHVTAKDLPRSPSVLMSKRTAAYWEICVADNGIGFDEKYLDRIFQVFQRLHGRNQFPGTGIGLAVCQKVVENHGGTITANSKPGEGATFRVFLPV